MKTILHTPLAHCGKELINKAPPVLRLVKTGFSKLLLSNTAYFLVLILLYTLAVFLEVARQIESTIFPAPHSLLHIPN